MTLEDIYEALSTGELSQTILGSSVDGVMEIPSAKRLQIRHSVQLALTDLHTRFLIREKSFKVTLISDKSTYVLSTRFTSSTPAIAGVVKYITDTDDAFEDNLLKIERIYDDAGEKVALNELDNDDAVRALADNIIAVPATLDTTYLTVHYRANHPVINKYLADSAPGVVEISLPIKYLQALLYFVASRALNPIGFHETMHEGNNFLQKYEMECQRLIASGAGIDTDTSNERVVPTGWV